MAVGCRLRRRLLAALLLVTPLGFLTKVYSGPGARWVAWKASGFLYVVFWILLVLALFPRLPRVRVAVGVALATSALEILQLWHPPFLERIRATFLGATLLGTTFAWSDFAYYAAGAVAGCAAARALTPNVRSPARRG